MTQFQTKAMLEKFPFTNILTQNATQMQFLMLEIAQHEKKNANKNEEIFVEIDCVKLSEFIG